MPKPPRLIPNNNAFRCFLLLSFGALLLPVSDGRGELDGSWGRLPFFALEMRSLQKMFLSQSDRQRLRFFARHFSRDAMSARRTITTTIFWKLFCRIFGSAGGVLMAVVSGVMFVLGGGNDDLRERAKKTLTFAIAGIVLAMFSYFIVEIVNRLPFSS